ncbi:ceramide glucosyltransferase [Microvirga makkahensis]|uniref:Glycosyltransferase n=1 Tax=Microvirga makkahensis TaxID=1128670 RepID=A0A7X3MNI5_9HYPH|nr:ceramide glucosyltransferase [Microvirga makkahensis]MXQ10260.1 glycosyltransferase [Microvirga makkahensis]
MIEIAAGILCLALTLANLVSIAIAAMRLNSAPMDKAPVNPTDPVTIIRPLCGTEPFVEETLASSFTLSYPHYELIFCVAQADDPIIPIISRLMAAHPSVPSRLLVGDDRISDNPKLNNCIKGWQVARFDWVVLADSNVLMPQDYIQQLLASWRPGTGLVCSTPIGSLPEGFWAEVECAFLNTLQARWQYVGESLGLGFAQGKSMLWRRDLLNANGGIRALAAEIAEDAAATKLVRKMGLHVHLVTSPFEQPLGRRTARQVWGRQTRWARLRRVTFPHFFAPEILTGAAIPLLAGTYFAAVSQHSIAVLLTLLALVWYGAEWALAKSKGWHVSWRYPIACLTRDCLIPIMWAYAWIGRNVVWRGNAMTIRVNGAEPLNESSFAR